MNDSGVNLEDEEDGSSFGRVAPEEINLPAAPFDAPAGASVHQEPVTGRREGEGSSQREFAGQRRGSRGPEVADDPLSGEMMNRPRLSRALERLRFRPPKPILSFPAGRVGGLKREAGATRGQARPALPPGSSLEFGPHGQAGDTSQRSVRPGNLLVNCRFS
ncbi:hypothetical protein AGIG_G25556 [Arapaima gigas]